MKLNKNIKNYEDNLEISSMLESITLKNKM